MNKKDLIVVALATFCLAATLFMMIPTRSEIPVNTYDPWIDTNDDGNIDILDSISIGSHFLASGTPINKTALLFEIQNSIDALNSSLFALQSIFNMSVTNLEAIASEQQIRIAQLEADLTVLNSTMLGQPVYDSGWLNVTDKCGQYFDITHGLNSTDVMVDIAGKIIIDGGTHQRYLGLTGYMPRLSKTYGGTNTDFGYSVVRTVDDGYAIAGETYSFGAGNGDVYLVKTDANGITQWSKTYGGTNTDYGYSVVQTVDGGFAVAGYTGSFGAGGDVYLVKTDANGVMQWSKTYGGISTDLGNSLVQTADGGFAIGGYTASFGSGGDVYLVKTDANGNMQWNETYGGMDTDFGYSLVKTVDGGFTIAGYTGSFGSGGADVYLVNTDADGNMQWNQTYGGTGEDYGYSVVQTVDGGFAVAGYTGSFGAGGDVYLVKTDANGNLQWSKTYGGTSTDYGYSVVQSLDRGFTIAGYTASFGAGNGDVYLVKTDAKGNMQWSRTYGGTNHDYGYSVVPTVDGGYTIAGYTLSYGAGNTDVFLVKTDAELGLAWIDSTADTLTLYRGATDLYWNFVRVRLWKLKTP